MNQDKKSSFRISLIDVLYGVVLAYGFRFFDEDHTALDYFRFFFTYIIIIIDYLYVHNRYWKSGYRYNVLLATDLLVLFIFSRLFSLSISDNPQYWVWMSCLFLVYVAWDIYSKLRVVAPKHDWRYSIGGDLFAVISILSLYVLLYINKLQPTVWWHLIVVIVWTLITYAIACRTWFKKAPNRK